MQIHIYEDAPRHISLRHSPGRIESGWRSLWSFPGGKQMEDWPVFSLSSFFFCILQLFFLLKLQVYVHYQLSRKLCLQTRPRVEETSQTVQRRHTVHELCPFLVVSLSIPAASHPLEFFPLPLFHLPLSFSYCTSSEVCHRSRYCVFRIYFLPPSQYAVIFNK